MDVVVVGVVVVRTTTLNLTGSSQADSSTVANVSILPQPVAAAKPQPVNQGSAAQPTLPQPQSTISFQPQSTFSFQPRTGTIRPAFGQSMQPSSQPVFGAGQAFSLSKQKDSTADPPKQPPQPSFSSLMTSTTKAIPAPTPANLSVLPSTASGSQSSGASLATQNSFLASMPSSAQSFNFGTPVGQSTPSVGKPATSSQLRFDATAQAASAVSKTVSALSQPASVSATSSRIATGDLDLLF